MQGRRFSIKGLLGNDVSATPFIGGALVIFRLAPQVIGTFFFFKKEIQSAFQQYGHFDDLIFHYYGRIIIVSICQFRGPLRDLFLYLGPYTLYE